MDSSARTLCVLVLSLVVTGIYGEGVRVAYGPTIAVLFDSGRVYNRMGTIYWLSSWARLDVIVIMVGYVMYLIDYSIVAVA